MILISWLIYWISLILQIYVAYNLHISFVRFMFSYIILKNSIVKPYVFVSVSAWCGNVFL